MTTPKKAPTQAPPKGPAAPKPVNPAELKKLAEGYEDDMLKLIDMAQKQ